VIFVQRQVAAGGRQRPLLLVRRVHRSATPPTAIIGPTLKAISASTAVDPILLGGV
jgi:hypothetical protein